MYVNIHYLFLMVRGKKLLWSFHRPQSLSTCCYHAQSTLYFNSPMARKEEVAIYGQDGPTFKNPENNSIGELKLGRLKVVEFFFLEMAARLWWIILEGAEWSSALFDVTPLCLHCFKPHKDGVFLANYPLLWSVGLSFALLFCLGVV